MLPFSDGKHHDVYGPDTLQVMGAAFDAAVQALRELQDRERARTRLALLILRHADRGEPATHLSSLSLLDFLRTIQ
jgi:hypothetical protein